MSLTGDFDTDSRILTQLSDKELEIVCKFVIVKSFGQ